MATVMTEFPQPRPPAASSRRFAPAVEVEQERGFEIRESYLRVTFPYREGFTITDSSEETTQKTTPNTTQKILAILRQTPSASRASIAAELGNITEDGVKYQLNKLKTAGVIRHIGSAKGGYWEVLNHGE